MIGEKKSSNTRDAISSLYENEPHFHPSLCPRRAWGVRRRAKEELIAGRIPVK
jgi:hypothetical protein